MAEAERMKVGDSWEEVNDYYFKKGWTDGLPIVPPTEERVQAMLNYTDRDPQEVIAILEPKRGVATVEKIATNAVMAGCLPQYLPVLIAAVKGAGEGRFNLYGIQSSTHNTSILMVANGPIAMELDINCGYNVTGDRWRSTETIGRAMRLIITNVGGVPGAVNVHTQGHIARFRHCIAENEKESPWEPLHVQRGFKRETSTITIFGACTPQMIDDNSGGKCAKDILNLFALSIPYLGNRNTNGEGEPFVIFGPQHANQVAQEGYTKQDVQRFLFERARLRFGNIPEGLLANYSNKWQKFYCNVSPDYGVPIADRPEDIVVIVMGGKGTHSLSVQTLLGSRSVTVPIADKNGEPVRSVEQLRRN